ncbi:MAG: 2-oxoacid:acceptor oxidoreductase family protein [Ruminococcus sp.]|jgi:pyruvate ferredoxin oxidoreductase gamma subunit|nr:2-oxoacid:acceptor oxidoreductase family protein [Ruminococcus sp.]
MIQILWKGRGGQGAFTAARLLGSAWVKKGGYALVFPTFGSERRGAPVKAFTKLDEKPIVDRSEIKDADFIIDITNAGEEDTALAEKFRLPTTNTIKFAKLAVKLGIEYKFIEQAIEDVMPEKIWERNKNAALFITNQNS